MLKESIHTGVDQCGMFRLRQREEEFLTMDEASTGYQNLCGMKSTPCAGGGRGVDERLVNTED